MEFCARRPEDIQTTCGIVSAEGVKARGYVCDLTHETSIEEFAGLITNSDAPVDILILNAAQWLSGELEDQPASECIATISSGLTGAILLTQALLPCLRRSSSADIISIISACGIPGFTDSIAHPAFFASKHGLSGFTQTLSHQLAKENIRVTGLYPPDFEMSDLNELSNGTVKMGEVLLNGRSIWEAVRFVLIQPRSCHVSTLYFQGPTRENVVRRNG